MKNFGTKQSPVTDVLGVTLGVANIQDCVTFYTDVWRLRLLDRVGDTILLGTTSCDDPVLGIKEMPVSQLVEVWLGTADQSAVDELCAQVSAAGAVLLSGPGESERTRGAYGFTFGSLGLPRMSVVAERRRSAVDAEDKDDPVRISHVVLNTPDRDMATEFCHSTLGFQLCDRTHMMHFLRCNPDHHSLALADAPSVSLNHVAYEMRSIDSLMRGAARLQDRGYPLEWGVGRHGPGNNIFAYFIDPAGFVAEYTTGMEQISDPLRQPGEPEDWDRFWSEMGKRNDRWGLAPNMSERLVAAMQGDM